MIHILTKKGKGYLPAEKYPSRYHGIEPFCIDNGEPLASKKLPSYTKVFSSALVNIARQNDKVVAVTAAMPYGTGLNLFKKNFPDRFLMWE